jgi:hypothetical protein
MSVACPLNVTVILAVVFHPAEGINIGLLNVRSVKGEMFELKPLLFCVQFRNTK